MQMKQEADAYMPPMLRTPAVQSLEKMTIEIAAQLGMNIKAVLTGGASDASYACAEGKPVIDGLGPNGGMAHSPGEYLEISSIAPRGALLAHLILESAQKFGNSG